MAGALSGRSAGLEASRNRTGTRRLCWGECWQEGARGNLAAWCAPADAWHASTAALPAQRQSANGLVKSRWLLYGQLCLGYLTQLVPALSPGDWAASLSRGQFSSWRMQLWRTALPPRRCALRTREALRHGPGNAQFVCRCSSQRVFEARRQLAPGAGCWSGLRSARDSGVGQQRCDGSMGARRV